MERIIEIKPLTERQRLVWLSQQLHPEIPLYYVAFSFRIHGYNVNSLATMEMCIQLSKLLSIEIPFSQLVLSLDVRGLAVCIDTETENAAG